MRVGILLPWVGGDLPAHLSFTCRSMAGGAATATLVLVHEARARRSVAPACRAQPNVDVVELLERIHCLEVQLFIGLAHGHRRLAIIRKHRVLNLVRDRCNRSE